MSRTRKTLVIITGTILLLIVLFFIVLATFDWNLLKPTINQKVSAELNRPFAIRGDLGVVWNGSRTSAAGAAGSRGPTYTRRISCWATRRPFPR
ncbi:AsmA family protein [Klebsiella pneumoniae]|nr:AsmA family protein [Klebsiella pneumoniae]